MKKQKSILNILYCALTLGLSTNSFADMTLDSSSSKLSLFSAKKEAKKKDQVKPKLSGTLSSAGNLKVVLDLKTIGTNIPLPAQYKGLLGAKENPQAILSANISDDLSKNGIKTIKTDATLAVYGLRQTVSVNVTVIRTGDKLMAASTKPAIITTPKINLGAGLPSIAGVSIPVSFVLVFNEDKEKPAPSTHLGSVPK